MKTYLYSGNPIVHYMGIGVLSILIVCMTSTVNGQSATDDGSEILTRGPIHEAFADVSVDETQPGDVIERAVPDPIEELPPDQRPEGDNVEWISGYWNWDDDRNDYIWVSGVWRDIPPGRQWVPGYWTSVDGSNHYISGFWTDVDQTETQYLPAPPERQETGPNSPAPTSNHSWTAGSWVWYENQYMWQPGFWVEERPNMIWIPAHYVWTPRGYIYVMGYWDYQMVHRGVMFAPVYYPQPTYRHQGFYFTPSIVLDIDALFFGLFIRTHSHHYYYGDYYDARYDDRGYRPWYSENATRYGYDPYYVYYRSQRIREDRDWENNYHQQYQYRRDHEEARPPRTYVQQANFNYNQTSVTTNIMIGRRFSDVADNKNQPIRFTRLTPDHKKAIQAKDRDLKTFRMERKKLEVAPTVEGKPLKPADIRKPVKLQMPKSPIHVKPGEKLDRGKPSGPDQKPDTIKIDKQPQEKPKDKPQVRPGQPQEKPQDKPQVRPGQPQEKPQDKPQVKPGSHRKSHRTNHR